MSAFLILGHYYEILFFKTVYSKNGMERQVEPHTSSSKPSITTSPQNNLFDYGKYLIPLWMPSKHEYSGA